MTTFNIGYDVIGVGSDSGNSDVGIGNQVTLPVPASLISLSFYVDTAAGQVNLGFYTNSLVPVGPHPAPLPLNLIYTTGLFTVVTGWNTVTLTTPIPLAADFYWIVFAPTDPGMVNRINPGVGKISFQDSVPNGTISNPAVVGGTGFSTFSMYATVDDSPPAGGVSFSAGGLSYVTA